MVRMRDVLKSAKDVMRNKPETGATEGPKKDVLRFPEQESKPEPTGRTGLGMAVSEQSVKEPAESHMADAGDMAQSSSLKLEDTPTSLNAQSPVRTDPYHKAISVVDDFLQAASEEQAFILDDIEAQAEEFVDLLEDSDQLFMQALSARTSVLSMAQHSVNVTIVAIKIANGLHLPREKTVEIGIASMVHEVGMVRVPGEVINKKGELSPSEYEMIKQHPIHGRNILETVRQDYPFLPDVIAQEHERWNGSGYPFGLKQEEIHQYAQVLGLADTFIALTHLRHYRDNFIAYKAIQSIIEKRNIDFSAKMIKALIEVISIFPVHSLVKLNDGCVAKVIQVNKNYPVRPVIEVVMDARGDKMMNPERIDLSREPMIYIVSPVLDESAYF